MALSCLRCSAHKLMIEEGRYGNIDRNLRICQFVIWTVETEYHFLLVCPAHLEIPNSCLLTFYCRWPTIHKFVQLMTNYQNGLVHRLAKYVYLAFEHRNSLLNWLSCIGIFFSSISPVCLQISYIVGVHVCLTVVIFWYSMYNLCLPCSSRICLSFIRTRNFCFCSK